MNYLLTLSPQASARLQDKAREIVRAEENGWGCSREDLVDQRYKMLRDALPLLGYIRPRTH